MTQLKFAEAGAAFFGGFGYNDDLRRLPSMLGHADGTSEIIWPGVRGKNTVPIDHTDVALAARTYAAADEKVAALESMHKGQLLTLQDTENRIREAMKARDDAFIALANTKPLAPREADVR